MIGGGISSLSGVHRILLSGPGHHYCFFARIILRNEKINCLVVHVSVHLY